ncbi:hypothetical protein STA3757_27110 [Stanieria sp. NIES-3757]|nr:hypothetical protein STA3757_27110 [Stanieria sp. NIES-3757]
MNTQTSDRKKDQIRWLANLLDRARAIWTKILLKLNTSMVLALNLN